MRNRASHIRLLVAGICNLPGARKYRHMEASTRTPITHDLSKRAVMPVTRHPLATTFKLPGSDRSVSKVATIPRENE